LDVSQGLNFAYRMHHHEGRLKGLLRAAETSNCAAFPQLITSGEILSLGAFAMTAVVMQQRTASAAGNPSIWHPHPVWLRL
jgi:hypothetical protein